MKKGASRYGTVESHKLVDEWIHEGSWPKLAVSPDDQLVAVASETIGIYTLEGRLVNSIDVSIFSLCFSPDSSKLVCGNYHNIFMCDVRTGALVLDPLQGHQDDVWSLVWSHDCTRIFSGSRDKTIRCWNAQTGEQIGPAWLGHTDTIKSSSLSPDGSILASASRDRTIRFWDATTGRPIGQHLRHSEKVMMVRFSPSGEHVASATLDGKLYLWRVPSSGTIEKQSHHISLLDTAQLHFLYCYMRTLFSYPHLTLRLHALHHTMIKGRVWSMGYFRHLVSSYPRWNI
ncbi:quinon protein alcohol dehydrogenase-like superfamily [Chiua virens]|nr:quinon protein alcohol dehydrogenase-like superfamily [Chiua virens]